MIGTTLAHYDIVGALGRGGMGEVWRARDTRLGRDVAIKTLPSEFASDEERLTRFQREARLLASLNHPNIGSIYGLEQFGETRFLVLELIEGDTLADRIARGPIDVEEAVTLAQQVAQALEAAHEKGVVHRDLKPANIKVTPGGQAKVLDFGLAKAMAGDEPDVNVSNSPTFSVAATRQGLILGTAAYMSPEQARGRATDKRADIWAFGCVLFECLTGRPAFPGEDVSDILASVLKSDPDWERLPPNVGAELRELLRRCLQKDVQQRYRDIGDVRLEIDGLLANPSRLLLSSVATPSNTSSRWLWVAALVLAIATGTAAWSLKPVPAVSNPIVTRFVHEVPASLGLNLTQPALAVSSSGDQFVYATREGLYLRRLNELAARRVAGTEKDAPVDPFFSPDGQWVGYLSQESGQLKKVRTGGGEPVFLANAAGSVYGPSWATNGWILYVQQPGIMRVPENGGDPSVLVEMKERVVAPVLLPDDDSLLFAVGSGNRRKVLLRSLATGTQTTLFDDADSGVRYLPSGHLVYGSNNDISVRTFDVKTKAVGGRVALVQNFLRLDGAPQFKVSDSGTLVYVPNFMARGQSSSVGDSLAFVDRGGKAELLPLEKRSYGWARFSPDDRRIALEIRDDQGRNIWTYEIDNRILNQITFDGGSRPIWSPDGKEITFLKDDALWTVRSDSTGAPTLLPGTKVAGNLGPGSWSPDSSVLLFSSAAGIHVWTRSKSTEPAPVVISRREGRIPMYPEFSSDGRWFTYLIGGPPVNPALYASPYPVISGNIQRLTPSGAAFPPIWLGRQQEILFAGAADVAKGLPPEMSVFSLPIATGLTLSRRNPIELFRFRPVERLFAGAGRNYDVSHDGRRFIVPVWENAATGAATNAPQSVAIHVVVNWMQELNTRVLPQR